MEYLEVLVDAHHDTGVCHAVNIHDLRRENGRGLRGRGLVRWRAGDHVHGEGEEAVIEFCKVMKGEVCTRPREVRGRV